jgi:hypothetical protein
MTIGTARTGQTGTILPPIPGTPSPEIWIFLGDAAATFVGFNRPRGHLLLS